MNPTHIDDATLQKIIKDQKVRRNLARQSLLWFFYIYFSHYVKCPIADFHREIFNMAENLETGNLAIVAFRGSAKSTIMNLAYPIWSILGFHQKKFILIAGQTQNQARQHLQNIKEELENNKLLKADLGPFEEQNDEWRSYSLVTPKYGARITAVSSEQSVRGIRHNEHRPDLIICDDIEDLASVKTRENRDKTYQWVTSELIPAGDRDTRTIMIGNLLHEDSVIMRMKGAIEDGKFDGVFKSYPLMDEDGKCSWIGKYPDEKSIEQERKRTGSESSWQREYLLNIVTDQDRVIFREWIQYYDEIPKGSKSFEYRSAYVGIDLAISKKDSADYTAMVACKMFGHGKDRKIYILPNPVNERLSHLETIGRAKMLADTLGDDGGKAQLYVEDVGYQRALIEQLHDDCYLVEAFQPKGQDKRARLASVSHMVQNGEVLFPKYGAERLIQQLTGFGLERHDDLADAFAIILIKLMSERGYWDPFFIPCYSGGDTIAGNLMEAIF